ncbi:alpha/beta hydrolase [Serratia sp. JUb9]|uniref:alpha/beta hydrolase n=1 Tax=Serratia sp. JUb9 TaxID=2724469 RepID=UPI00164DBC5E|nr:alpha/beta hydrolase-fold protein [Serratia sp. JUb9]QNK33579.1 alpha/beta hydrolase [Serratia sp. JUb9]
MPLFYHRFYRVLFVLLVSVCATAPASARPDLDRRIGVTVAERGTADYAFSDFRLASADGERHYRIRIAKPKQAAPAAGYPVIYFLDGNAVLMQLNAGLLQRLAQAPHPPLLVMLSYDNDLRIDAAGRAYDYTPALPAGQRGHPVQMGRWRSGGADAFATLLEQRIKPQVAARVTVDPQRQTLWGHSYGALFVLHTLFQRPQLFQHYIAVEPSLWWGKGQILKEAQAFVRQSPVLNARLQLWVGQQAPEAQPHPGERTSQPADVARQLSQRLDTLPGLRASYRQWPALSHGAMLDAAIAPALEGIASGQ